MVDNIHLYKSVFSNFLIATNGHHFSRTMAARGASMSSSQAVAETFEEELASITEKGKDLKGEQRIFYQSIVERIKNNVEALAEMRSDHSQLRARLAELVQEKNAKANRQSLEADLKHTEHEVNLLKMQIDRVKCDRERCIERQHELEVALANYKNAASNEHPEEQRIRDMKNKLDRANIKNGETLHLMKMYQKIVHLLDKQKCHWTPILQQKQAQLAQKERDIAELSFIARDSKYSRSVAASEMRRTEAQVVAAMKKRKEILHAKKMKSDSIEMNRPIMDQDPGNNPARTRPSLTSQSSVLRNKMYKAQREKREEKFRQVSSVYEDIRDRFGTNEPEKIKQFFEERREQTETLQKQIDELKVACAALERKSEQLKSAIEEAEYASSKGVGGNRLLLEGRGILRKKQDELSAEEKQIVATAQHQKKVLAGISHITDVLALVQDEDEEVPTESSDIAQWIKGKVEKVKAMLEEEDVEWLENINKPAFALAVQRSEVGFEDESQKKAPKKTEYRRPARDPKADISTRVLDRATVKMQAAKTVQQAQQAENSKKKNNQTK